MTPNHERHMLVTLRHIDNLLSEAERVFLSADSGSPFGSYSQPDTPLQRTVIQSYIDQVRDGLRRALDELGLARPAPLCSALWAARGHVAQAGNALFDLESERMRSYGVLEPADADHIDRVGAELKSSLERLSHYLSRADDSGFRARLEKLEQQDGIGLLRELERIITRYGLVEFRGPLARLLEPLEGGSFEIGIFGRVSSGKSSLLNYLLGVNVLPRGVIPVTAIPTRVRYGPRPLARVEFARSPALEIELAEVSLYASEQKNPGNLKQVSRITVDVPSPRLREGVTFVDTPGLGSLAKNGVRETSAYLPRCNLGLVLIDAASTLTREDLMLVFALHQSAASPMVLLSKSDLLTPEELQQSMQYLQNQLVEQVGEPVPIHAVSVSGSGAELCDRWFASELEPLFKNHRDQLAASLKRKIWRLCEGVVRTLEVRQGDHVVGSTNDSALAALRQADSVIQNVQRAGTDVVEETPKLALECLTAVAAELALAWEKQTDAGPVFASSLVNVLSSHTAWLVAILEAGRMRLEETLALAQAALHLSTDGEPLPRPASLPVFDPAIVTAGYALPKPPVLPMFGAAVLRRYALSRLQPALQEPLARFLSEYSQRLRPWLRESLRELQEGFLARAVPLRAQLQSSSATNSTDASADLQQLREWMQS